MAAQTEKMVSVGPRDPRWAWSRYEPNADRPWTLALAGHLYRRAAFGANWSQLQRALSDGPQQTIDRLLVPQVDAEAFNRTYDEQEGATGSIDGLRAWWLRRMIETPHPLLEKMTLFWHGHFAIDATAVTGSPLVQAHIRLLRDHALGSFDSLLREISQDPAVLLGLGADVNRKASPNEGFVRPLLETFTLGPGQFTDEDVREAARAFTGRFVLRNRLRSLPAEHDESVKHVLGREGDFTGDDIVRIVLEHPATSRTLVRKLYRRLISETEEPDDALIAPLAESFAGDYSISKLVETMLRSNLFFSQGSYRQRIKSPVEFAVGLVRAMEGMVSTTQLAQDLAGLGQDLCHPPTVRGWKGGRYWINAATLAGRANLAAALLRGEEPYGDRLDPQAIAR
ncbi:MAG: DUF1800 domain-containing protein, partial [Sedimentisphaerales bacterium]|nr:DUF1800 domain-containing protein [Sedimentisphaerales bacterium]